MSFLSKVTTGRLVAPHLVLIYGVDGVGKSTFGAYAPKPIFLGTERGTKTLPVARGPKPENFSELLSQLVDLTIDKHDYKTLVLDSLDWMEELVMGHLCRVYEVPTVESVLGGFNKWTGEALKEWRKLRDALVTLQDKRGMNVVLIAHAIVKKVRDPETGMEYDRHQVKLEDKAAALFREMVDSVLFAKHDETLSLRGKDRKATGYSDGERVMYTQRRTAWDAKNRFSLPFKMELSWAAYDAAVRSLDTRSAAQIAESILRLLDQVTDADVKQKARAHTETVGDNVLQLTAIERRLIELTTEEKK